MKVTGLDKLQRDLKAAQSALQTLDGELGNVSFDANDPASIEQAINEVTRIVDARVGRHSGNPFIKPIIAELKEKFRKSIIDRAAVMRLTGSRSHND